MRPNSNYVHNNTVRYMADIITAPARSAAPVHCASRASTYSDLAGTHGASRPADKRRLPGSWSPVPSSASTEGQSVSTRSTPGSAGLGAATMRTASGSVPAHVAGAAVEAESAA